MHRIRGLQTDRVAQLMAIKFKHKQSWTKLPLNLTPSTSTRITISPTALLVRIRLTRIIIPTLDPIPIPIIPRKPTPIILIIRPVPPAAIPAIPIVARARGVRPAVSFLEDVLLLVYASAPEWVLSAFAELGAVDGGGDVDVVPVHDAELAAFVDEGGWRGGEDGDC